MSTQLRPNYAGHPSITTHKFTGDERDSESNLDHTWFRQYSSSLGRWMHPDPAGLAAVDPSNPQTWNRYAYVLNNPLAHVDPFGLDSCDDLKGDCCPWDASCEGGGGIGIGIGFGGGGGGGGVIVAGSGGIVQSRGTTPIPPPNNPGTTFPGIPVGQEICIIFDNGVPVCIDAAVLPSGFFAKLRAALGGAALVSTVFLSALGNNFIDEFKSGCVSTFVDVFNEAGLSHITAPLTGGADLPPGVGLDDIIREAGRAGALTYQMRNGLIVHLRSSIFRGILSGSERAAGAVAAVDLSKRAGEGFIREMIALGSGACQ